MVESIYDKHPWDEKTNKKKNERFKNRNDEWNIPFTTIHILLVIRCW